MVSDGSFTQEDFSSYTNPNVSRKRRERAKGSKYTRTKRESIVSHRLLPVPIKRTENDLESLPSPTDVLSSETDLTNQSNSNQISVPPVNDKPLFTPDSRKTVSVSRSKQNRILHDLGEIRLENQSDFGQLSSESVTSDSIDLGGLEFETTVRKTYQKRHGNALFIVEPQQDFEEGGAVPTVNAFLVAERICDFISKNVDSINQIFVSLNSRNEFSISNPTFWVDEEGIHPSAFQKLSLSEIQERKWIPADSSFQKWALEYVDKLLEKGRDHLAIWPEYCVEGREESFVSKTISEAIEKWEKRTKLRVKYVEKGMNSLTEQYSAFQAEVPVDNDASTQKNTSLLDELNSFQRIILCGYSGTYGLEHTVQDLAKNWTSDRKENLIVLGNAISYSQENNNFLDKLELEQKIQVDTTDVMVMGEAAQVITTKTKLRSLRAKFEAFVAGKEADVVGPDGAGKLSKKVKRRSKFKWTRNSHGSYKRIEILDSTSTL
mmetsp:Transcript_6833/g.7813  ORF Transcript_6833/g.7813 Transcript_6833/m.7813 type:complete len:491 (+) Transcript_6833:194-1666(+)